MNSDMLAAGVEVGDRYDFDVVHGHDWLVASAGDHLAKRFRAPLVVTIHATEYGRHQGWVDKHPQSYIHGVERWMANRAERLITCSSYMREHVADIYGLEESRVHVIPNGIDPSELVPVDDLDTLRARFAAPDERLVLLVGRLVYEKGFQLALEALPGLIERVGNVRFIVAGSGTAEQELREQASAARPRRARHLPRLDRRRRAALALPDRRPHGGALDLRAVRARGARGDGVRLPVPRGRHRRPARGGAERGRGAALPLARPGLARDDGRAPAHRRGAARPPGGRGLGARADASTGRTWRARWRRVYREVTRGRRTASARRAARSGSRPPSARRSAPAVCSPAKASGPVGSLDRLDHGAGGEVE